MKTRKLGSQGLEVSAEGLGCMGMSEFYGVTDDAEAKRVLRLMDAIDDHDDVQNVHANFDMPDAVLAAYEG